MTKAIAIRRCKGRRPVHVPVQHCTNTLSSRTQAWPRSVGSSSEEDDSASGGDFAKPPSRKPVTKPVRKPVRKRHIALDSAEEESESSTADEESETLANKKTRMEMAASSKVKETAKHSRTVLNAKKDGKTIGISHAQARTCSRLDTTFSGCLG